MSSDNNSVMMKIPYTFCCTAYSDWLTMHSWRSLNVKAAYLTARGFEKKISYSN